MKNTFKENEGGLYLRSSSYNNIIYKNNFISNNEHFFDDSRTTQWNYYGQGNYWSDYTGEDCGGVGCIEGDYIGDTNVPYNEVDQYPYTKPDGWEIPMEQNKVKNIDEPDYGDINDDQQGGGFDWLCNGLPIIILIIIIVIILLVGRRRRTRKNKQSSNS